MLGDQAPAWAPEDAERLSQATGAAPELSEPPGTLISHCLGGTFEAFCAPVGVILIESGDKVRIEFGEGMHPALARGDDGGYRGSLHDGDNPGIAGHARIYEIDDDESDADGDGSNDELSTVIAAAVSLAVGVIGTIVVLKNAPRIKGWWTGRVAPSLRSRLGISPRQQGASSNKSIVTSMLRNDGARGFSKEIDEALNPKRVKMSAEEADRKIVEVFLAAAFIATRMRELSNADVENSNRPELEAALAKLTPQDVTDTVNRALERHPALIDDASAGEFVRVFGGGQVVDGSFVPVKNDQVKKALRLTEGDEDAAPAIV